MKRSATISDCGRYRYTLDRQWRDDDSYAVFIMLNPSTADAEKDDPTVRRCIAYAKAWGMGGLVVVNLFAYRATDPKELYRQDANNVDIVGPENDRHIVEACIMAQFEVAAWGVHGALNDRGRTVRDMFRSTGPDLKVLKLSRGGHPCHPLYLPKTLKPIPWSTQT